MTSWKRTHDCLLCGCDRCMEDKDSNYGVVGYCFRMATMHRNGKPFIKKDGLVMGKAKRDIMDSFEGGVRGGELSEKFPPPNSDSKQALFEFE